jgi:hypothetical protein
MACVYLGDRDRARGVRLAVTLNSATGFDDCLSALANYRFILRPPGRVLDTTRFTHVVRSTRRTATAGVEARTVGNLRPGLATPGQPVNLGVSPKGSFIYSAHVDL